MTETGPFAETIAGEVERQEAELGQLVHQNQPGRPAIDTHSSALGDPGATNQITVAPIGWVPAPSRGKWHTDQGLGGAWALLSPDRRYRYAVRRLVDETPITDPGRRVVFVTLRPEGGDAEANDRPISRCRQIAARLGAAEMVVVSLFGLRNGPLDQSDDPVGPGLEEAMRVVFTADDGIELIVIACWGSKLPAMYGGHVRDLRTALEDINAQCFGTTSNGHPVSVLSDLRADAPLVPLAAV